MKTLNLIALALFIAACVAVFTLDTPATKAVQGKVMAVFAPFIHASGTVESTTTRAIAPDVDPRELMRENDSLRQKVQKLTILSQRHDELLDENNKLRNMIGYRERAPFKDLIAARVIKRSAATWWNTLIIDKGSAEGVTPDSAVLTDVGLVGKTGRVSPHVSEVILLTDELCKVAAVIDGTREKGILNGERGALDVTPDLRLRFLSRNAPIAPGTNVLSSGDGGVFPSRLLLGRVKLFENKDISGEAVVEPAVDFAKLEDVFVVGSRTEAPAAKPVPAATAAPAPPRAIPVEQP